MGLIYLLLWLIVVIINVMNLIRLLLWFPETCCQAFIVEVREFLLLISPWSAYWFEEFLISVTDWWRGGGFSDGWSTAWVRSDWTAAVVEIEQIHLIWYIRFHTTQIPTLCICFEWCPKQEVDLNNKILTLPPCGALIMKVIRLLACYQRQELKSENMERHGEEKWTPLEVLKRLSRD